MKENIEKIVCNYCIKKDYLKKLEKYSKILEDKNIDIKDPEKIKSAIHIYDIVKQLEDIPYLLNKKYKNQIIINKENIKYLQIYAYDRFEINRNRIFYGKKIAKFAIEELKQYKLSKTIIKTYNKKTKYTYSNGEKQLLQFFKQEKYNKYLIIPEKYLDVKYKSNLRADFYIYLEPNNKNKAICVEFDGKQHFNIDSFLYTDELPVRDELKNKFCFDNYISFIRFTDFDFFRKHIDNIIEKTNNNSQVFIIQHNNTHIIRSKPDNIDIPDEFHQKITFIL